jgi:predicted transcriptional regulator
MAPKGLFKVLGPREQEVIEVFWELGRSTTVEIQIQSHLSHSNISTISTTIRYLMDKGLEVRETTARRRDGYFSTRTITKEELMLQAVKYMLNDLCATPGERRRLAEALLEK